MSPRRVPAITHLQFLVLGVLRPRARLGRHLRRRLEKHGVRRSAPAFYQMMARLEDAGWVEGSYTQQIVDGQIIKERGYRITATGQKAWTAPRDFYLDTASRAARAAGDRPCVSVATCPTRRARPTCDARCGFARGSCRMTHTRGSSSRHWRICAPRGADACAS